MAEKEKQEQVIVQEQQEEMVTKSEFLNLLEDAQNLSARYAKLVELYNVVLEKYIGGK